jgi:phosphohistidine swiveling domain-containing protein
MILWFNEVSKKDIAAAGGKGANLGEMARSGFPVPPGFCIDTQAYREHIHKLEMEPLIEALSSYAQKESLQELDEISGRIRKRIEEAQMPARAEQAIRDAYRKLAGMGSPLVSVRSSATAEDLPNASFAGQQETYLSVCGEEQVLHYVRRCWASLWTPRSVAYRQKNGFRHEKVALCVVVQSMVQSEKSGVLFTVNPLTGNAGEMMINASYGLGESIVSGRVTPDTFRISRTGPLVLERRLGAKETQIVTGPGGLTTVTEVAEELRNSFCLEEAELRGLLDLGLRVENHYGRPQDIEWAIADGKLFLLQTRPVTAAPAESSIKTKKMSRAQQKILDNFKEHIPDAPYPLDYEPLLALNRQKNAVFHELGLSMPAEHKMVRMDAHGILSLGKLLPHPNIRILWAPFSIRRMLEPDFSAAAKGTEIRLLEELRSLENTNVSGLDGRMLADYIRRTVDTAMQWIHLRFRVYVFPMVFMGFSLKRMIRKAKLGKSVSQYDFLAGLDYKTAEIEQALYKLAEQADNDPAVRRLLLEKPPGELLPLLEKMPESRMFHARLTEFLKDYGARTVKAYTPFSAESWSERPELLLNTLAAILKAGDIRRSMEQQESGRIRYAELKDKAKARLSAAKGNRLEALLERFRSAHLGREELVYRMEQCYVAARRGVREAARRLREEGLLTRPEDIRYLTLSELNQALSGTADAGALGKLLAGRKAHRREAEEIWNASPAEGVETGGEGATVRGLSGSPGTAKGAVRIIHSPDEFARLQKGEVLVCRFTDPAWTPLFSVACAVVCDTGGPLSHAAIVAREYGMPAVLGAKNATAALKDGDMAVVDGSKGIVRVER